MRGETEILEALPEAVYLTDAEGRITFYNEAAAELWGHRPELGTSRWCGSWRLFWPDGRPMAHDECPMAVSLREGRPVRGAQAIAERPDGSRVVFRPHPSLLHDASGKVTGAINLLVDVTDRAAAELDSARLAAIVASSDDAIVSKNLDGVVTSWNAGATRIFGYEPEEMIGQSILRLIPAELRSEEESIISRIRQGIRVDHFDTVRTAKDGRRLHVSLTVSPIRNAAGKVVGASKIARDITERKASEEMLRLLFSELNHRVKNTLATIQAIATQSLRAETDPRAFVASFTGRIQALARAHDLLVQGQMRGADLVDLVREQVDLGTGDPRISWSGPTVTLDPRTAVQMALVLHELATNARKYGALSAPTGRLTIGWTTTHHKARDLLIEWRETGVPQVTPPVAGGFGTKLIERAFEASEGETAISYSADGVLCEIRLPLPDAVPAPGLVQATISGAEPRGDAPAPELGGRRILVVEDEPLVAMEIEEMLLAAGCSVVGPAASLAAAQRLIGEAAFEAALLDANLAGRRVDDLAAALTSGGIPFAFVTGYQPESLPEGFGKTPFLAKPFSDEELLATVRLLFADRTGGDVLRFRAPRP